MSRFSHIVDNIEETSIALCMGLMTLITFANVIARFLDSNILWALEATVFLFAWLVLMGMSYGVKKQIHIGVDILIVSAPPQRQKVFALLAATACIAFAVLLLIGSWNYWYPFVSERAWLETDDIPMPVFLGFLADWMNQGEAYEKIPRWIPYLALPLGVSLLLYRFLQLGWKIITGEAQSIISTHDIETDVPHCDVINTQRDAPSTQQRRR